VWCVGIVPGILALFYRVLLRLEGRFSLLFVEGAEHLPGSVVVFGPDVGVDSVAEFLHAVSLVAIQFAFNLLAEM